MFRLQSRKKEFRPGRENGRVTTYKTNIGPRETVPQWAQLWTHSQLSDSRSAALYDGTCFTVSSAQVAIITIGKLRNNSIVNAPKIASDGPSGVVII